MLGLRTLRRIGPLGAVMTAGQVAVSVHRHWRSIPPEQRMRLGQLLRQAKENRLQLSASERRELRGLVRGLKLPRLLRQTAVDAALMRRLRPPS